MKCFYHADADGRCAARIIYSQANIHDYEENGREFIEINYDKHFPIETIAFGEQVFIVDYSIDPQQMLDLMDITKDITWIDHHKTAIERYTNFPYAIRGIRYDGIAACMLTWCYLLEMTDGGDGDIQPLDLSMTESAPHFIKFIADWDACSAYKTDGSRDFKYGSDTSAFVTYFNAFDFSPLSSEWTSLLYGSSYEAIKMGEKMLLFRDNWAREYCKTRGFEVNFEGNICYAMNLGLCNSEYFKSVAPEGYDILIPFSYDGSKWIFSMYSTTVDVSIIAKKYNGGGHKGAAGFVLDALPLTFRKEIN